MLRHATDIKSFKLSTADDEFGRVKEFYFDDLMWKVRYLRVDTIRWWPSKDVLVSPKSVAGIDEEDKVVRFNLTKDQIKNSPDIDADKPVSRQDEEKIVQHYDWPYYWKDETVVKLGDPNLRKTKEVIGYSVKSGEKEVGKLDNMIIDDADWSVRYLVIDAGDKHVLLSPEWVTNISSDTKEVTTDIDADRIDNAPEYDPDMMVERSYEQELYDNYGRQYYW